MYIFVFEHVFCALLNNYWFYWWSHFFYFKMLSFVLRRTQFAAHKVTTFRYTLFFSINKMIVFILLLILVSCLMKLQHCGAPLRCWSSALAKFEEIKPTSSIVPSARRLCSERSDGTGRDTGLLHTGFAPLYVSSRDVHSSAARWKKRAQPEAPLRELDLLRYDMKDLGKSPRPALLLGFAGLIPFVAPTLFMAVTESYCSHLAFAQLTYGASILSFLGGARWGFALPDSSPAKPDWINLANSVVLPLLAWVAVLMGDSFVAAVVMVIMGFGVSLHYDLALLPTYPSWFKALRFVLTIVAVLSLAGTLTMQGVYPEKKIFSD